MEGADQDVYGGFSSVSSHSAAISSSNATNQEGLDQLKDIFPEKSTNTLQNVLTCHRSVRQAALFLTSENSPCEIDVDEGEDDSLLELFSLQQMKKQIFWMRC